MPPDDETTAAPTRAVTHPTALRTAIVFAALLGCLTVAGALAPGSMNWGFHLLGFLPRIALWLYIPGMLLAAIAASRGWLDAPVRSLALRAQKSPLLALAGAGLLLVGGAFVFRITAPLLGDSFTFIKNLTDALDGTYPLGVWHEPFAMYFLFYAMKAAGSLAISQVISAFYPLDIVCGLVYVGAVAGIVRELFVDPEDRLLMFLWVLLLPTTVFFFGYVEVYAFTTMVLALYVYLMLLVLNGKASVALLPPAFLLALFVHYLNGLLGLALLYVVYRELRAGKLRQAALGVGVAAIGFVSILAAAHFEIGNLMDESPISHFLSLTSDVSMFNAYSQAFTLFSVPHALELVNYALLMSPFAFLLIALFVKGERSLVRKTPALAVFSLITFPYLLLIGATKIQQGMGNDWDVCAQYFVLFTLGAGLMASRSMLSPERRKRLLVLVVAVTAVQSSVWFSINASPESTERRIKGLFDPHMVSQLGHYTIVLHLSRYHDYRGDSLEQPALWERYSELYPGDPRGYENALDFLRRRTEVTDREQFEVYAKWAAIDPANAKLRSAFAELCTAAGLRLLREDSSQSAVAYLERAQLLRPGSATAANNLGGALARSGRPAEGAKFFLDAIGLDSTFSDAYYNLGLAYEDMGDAQKSAAALRRSAELGNAEARRYLGSPKKPE